MTEAIPKPSGSYVPTRTLIVRYVAGAVLINFFVVGIALLSLYQSRQQYESRVAIQTQNLSNSLNLTIAGILDKTRLALFAVKREAEKQLRNGSLERNSLNEYIRYCKGLIPELDGLRIANSNGEVVYGDKVVPGSRVSIADRDYFIYARNNPNAGFIISKPIFGRSAQKWVFNIAHCINNADGSFAGIVYGAISLDYLTKLFSSFDLGSHGAITLRDNELTVIVRYPEPAWGSSIGSKIVSKEYRALTRAGKTYGTYKIPGSIDAVERTFSFNKISNYPLYVNVGRATNNYLSPWRTEAKQLLLLTSLFTLVVMISAWLLYRNRKFEKMAEAELVQYREHLEETVTKRTSELESKNDELTREIITRRQIEADLHKAAIIMDRMSDAVDWISKEGKFLYVNDASCKMRGYSREEMLTMTVPEVVPSFPIEVWQHHWEELKREGIINLETVTKTRDGREFPIEVTANYLNIDGTEYNCAIVRDLTDRKNAEIEKQNLLSQLSQSQKMESIGRLAAGIAHDFNNLLTPILVYAELIKRNQAPESRDYARVETIMQAADKARILTQQLLSFGRKQILEMKTVDLNHVILTFQEILRRTIRENIDVQLHLTEDVCGIRADKNQLEQILMNLAINAQDAIREKGVITIETTPTILDGEYARQHAGVTSGKYLMLTITDTGSGMDQKTLDHIFEPFFTTKGIGEGTGLGLATVYGIVKQHEGHVWVYSEVGQGTAFKIYFPIVDVMPPIETKEAPENPKLLACNLTILLVDDNEMVRNLACDLLTNCGCKVISAEGPKQALKMSVGEQIDLLLTDVVMPDMNGYELHQRLLETHHNLKVLYMSGYTNNTIACHGITDEGMSFIQKPFTANGLIQKVEEILSFDNQNNVAIGKDTDV